VSLAAVQKALRAGRITLLPDGTIDPEAADQTWNAAAEAAPVPPDARKVVLPPRQFAAAEATVQAVLGEHGVEVNGAIRLADVRLANELLRAQWRADMIRAQRARLRFATGADLDAEADAGFDEVGGWWHWCDATATELAAALGVRRMRVQEPLAVALRRRLEDLGLVAREDQDDAADEDAEDAQGVTNAFTWNAEEEDRAQGNAGDDADAEAQHAGNGEDDEEDDDEDLEEDDQDESDQDESDDGEPDDAEEPLRVGEDADVAAAGSGTEEYVVQNEEVAGATAATARSDPSPAPRTVLPVPGPAPITWRRSPWWKR
jgi:hypothetical protein